VSESWNSISIEIEVYNGTKVSVFWPFFVLSLSLSLPLPINIFGNKQGNDRVSHDRRLHQNSVHKCPTTDTPILCGNYPTEDPEISHQRYLDRLRNIRNVRNIRNDEERRGTMRWCRIFFLCGCVRWNYPVPYESIARASWR
jgi:hypothetical protein